jgi:enoyl-CoA hydratase
MSCILLAYEGGIATITINRPQALNALNHHVIEELEQTFSQLRTQEDLRCIIITGSGEKSFVAGADIKELAALTSESAKTLAMRGQALFRTIETFPVPTIAAINGFALGGGCELAMACSIRIAGEHALLGLPEVSLGLIPGYGGTQRLARLVGKGHAIEMIASAGKITAERAAHIGLVNQVVPKESLMDTCIQLAKAIARNAPVAIQHAMESIHLGYDLPQPQAEAHEAALFALLMATDDAKEGLNAFIEKRKADFKGASR